MRQKKTTISTSKNSSNSTHRQISISDLVTQSEAALSSQATVYSQRTQASTQYGSIDNDYQFNRQDAGQIFINKQQENVIQQILQFSRKGKINQNNAFDIPLKVMSSQGSQNSNAKFWKFASELLNASMSIYDKRVQNYYINVHKICNKINRINGNNSAENQKDDDALNNEDRVRNAENNKRAQLLNIRIQDYASLNEVDSLDVGFSTLEAKQKINIKKIENQFIADPLFLKTQKMFDSYSLRSLMLNIFNLGENADVKLFNDKIQKKKQVQTCSTIEIEYDNKKQNLVNMQKKQSNCEQTTIYLEQKNENDQQYSQQTKNMKIEQVAIPYQIMQKYQKIEFISKNQTLFKQINLFIEKTPEIIKNQKNIQEDFKNQASRQQADEFRNLFNQITEHISIEGIAGSNMNQHQLYEVDQQSVQSSPFHFATQDTLNITNPIEIKSTWSQRVNNMFHSQGQTSQDSYFLLSEENDHNTMMTPWQIQFKNQKLIKKKKRQNLKSKQSKNKSQKAQHQQFFVNFDSEPIDRSAAIKMLSNTQINKIMKNNSKDYYEDVNISPMNYDIYAIYHKKMKNRLQRRNQQNQLQFDRNDENTNFQNQPESFPFDLGYNHSRNNEDLKQPLELQNENNNQRNYPLDNDINPQNYDHFSSTFGFGNNIGIHNMRQIKKNIYDQIKKRGKLKMSEIQLNLSPAQILISCLHLVNQHNLQIISLDDQEDYLMKLPPTRQSQQIQI